MALPIRQGATHKVVIGPAVAVGDGFTPVTNLAVSSADEAEVLLHDNGTVVDISGYTFAAIATADGYYHLTLQSGISGTVGHMTVVINDDSLVLPIKADFVVLDTGIYDSIYADAAVGIAAQVFDEALSGHVALGTFGQVMNALGMRTGAVNDGSATTLAFIVDGFIEATGDHFNGGIIVFTSGALLGQTNLIIDYSTTTQSITLASALTEAPANNDEFVIVSGTGLGGASLASRFSKGIALLNTSGQVQAVTIGTNAFVAAKFDSSVGTEFANANWNKLRSENVTAGTFGDSFQTVVNGAAEAGTLSTTEMTTDLTEATNEHYNGRIVIWTSGVLKNQASDITAYLGSTGKLTYTAVTEAPSAADTFLIY